MWKLMLTCLLDEKIEVASLQSLTCHLNKTVFELQQLSVGKRSACRLKI